MDSSPDDKGVVEIIPRPMCAFSPLGVHWIMYYRFAIAKVYIGYGLLFWIAGSGFGPSGYSWHAVRAIE